MHTMNGYYEHLLMSGAVWGFTKEGSPKDGYKTFSFYDGQVVTFYGLEPGLWNEKDYVDSLYGNRKSSMKDSKILATDFASKY